MYMSSGQWAQTAMMAGILGSNIDQKRLQERQLFLLQRQKDLQIMAAKYPVVDQITLEQWLDQYYYWKYGPRKSRLQRPGFRVGVPFLITGLVFVITVLSGLSTKYSAVSSISSQQINHSIGVVFFGTFFAAVISLVVCNVIGAMKAKERRDNWPVKPQATPEIY